jgi:cytochrome c peroxidase
MNCPTKKIAMLLVFLAAAYCLSFTIGNSPKVKTADYYDVQTDKLLLALTKFRKTATATNNRDTLLQNFFECRNAYKRIELFVDAFIPFKARVINGPDLLKIDEENPTDSMKPHGFQVIEGIIYADVIKKTQLLTEIKLLIKNITLLRNDPDRVYYFSDDKIWQAMRLAVYRTISMGITGFDVPLCYHALPETRNVLASLKIVTGFYKGSIPDSILLVGNQLIKKADGYLTIHSDFNTFDRLTFIRDFLNPISGWLAMCSRQYGLINSSERTPLNPFADNLFAPDIINMAFFSPNDNFKITTERVALGKRLFYDPILSGDGSRSCASCHKPELAFTDGVKKQTNMTGNKTLLRNTPTLWNAALQTAQFYDSRTKKLENQLSAVVHNADEMNGSLRNCIPRLAADKIYNEMFKDAYPAETEHISEYNIANAISSYVRTLISFNSRFDQYMRLQSEELTASEKNGFNLFMGKAKCGTCHYAPIFNGLIPPRYEDTESETLGVPATDDPVSTLDEDAGKYNFTHHPFHKYAFKTPTVRNIALTAPYMHNGVFATLEAVIDFYNDGGGAGRGITLPTQTLPTDKLDLSAKEKKDIVAFLSTLTDTSGNKDGKRHLR